MAVVERMLVRHVAKKFPKPMKSGIDVYDTCHTMIIEVEAEGLTGLGYTFVFSENQARALIEMAKDLAPCIIGRPVEDVRLLWNAMWNRMYFTGHCGPGLMAASAIETALWDVFAKQTGLPLFRLLGGFRKEIPVYVTGGWLSQTPDELIQEIEKYVEKGFRAFKMKVGQKDWRVDVERVKTVRSVFEDRIDLMVDANQAWDHATAIFAGTHFGELGVKWFEEPLSIYDVEGSSKVAESLTVPIAVGESAYNRYGLQTLIDGRCGDIIMPDLARCGGIGEMVRIAAAAQAKHLDVSPHMFWEVSAHLVSSFDTGIAVEYLPDWWDDIFVGPRMLDGKVHLEDRPGLGMEINRETLKALELRQPLSIVSQ